MKSITEILGTVTTQNPTGPPNNPPNIDYNVPAQGGANRFAGFTDAQPLCQQMRPWQKEIYGTLRSSQGAYVTASPGGGKTLPYICYWLDYVVQLNTSKINPNTWNNLEEQIYNLIVHPEEIDKMLIMVPTRSLADQTTQEFREYFSKILAQALSLYFSTEMPRNRERFNEVLQTLEGDNHLVMLFDRRFSLMQQLNARGQGAGEVRDPNNAHIVDMIATTEQELNASLGNSVREFIANEGDSSRSLICLRTGLNKEGHPKYAPVSITIYESAKSVISDIKSKLKLVVTDESHLSQSREINDEPRRYNIAISLYGILRTLKNNKDVKYCFLSGTENPAAAQNLVHYIRKCFKIDITVIESTSINSSNISIVPDDSILNDRELLNIIVKPKQSNNLIILFSKMRIDKLTEIALRLTGRTTSHQVDRGQFQKHQFGGGVIGRGQSSFSRRPGQHPQIDKKAIAKEGYRVPGSSQIFDPVLRQAVNSGFGWIYRIDEKTDRDAKAKAKDSMIVANLFKTGKIKTLLATDAVGIGVNIDVKTLFIPFIDKPQGNRFQEMNETELSQLLNRAGRGAFRFSTVVTPAKNIGAISNALSIGLNNFEQTTTVEFIPRLACVSASTFISFWKSIYPRRR